MNIIILTDVSKENSSLVVHSMLTPFQSLAVLLKKVGLYPDFPPYMKRGGCIGCYYKSDKEFLAMAALNPDEFKIVEDLENWLNENLTRRKTYFSIRPTKTMKQIRVEAETSLFKPEEIYATINDQTKCGVFCNR